MGLYSTSPHHTTPHYTTPHHTTPQHTTPHHSKPHLTTPCQCYQDTKLSMPCHNVSAYLLASLSSCPLLVSCLWLLCACRVEKLGYPVPVFDFRLPGVTSMSADIHKYGLGIKVQSVTMTCMYVRTYVATVCEVLTGCICMYLLSHTRTLDTCHATVHSRMSPPSSLPLPSFPLLTLPSSPLLPSPPSPLPFFPLLPPPSLSPLPSPGCQCGPLPL